jgi:hypothetical protein
MKKFALCVALGSTAVGAFAFFHQSSNLYIGGNLASSNVIQRNGVSYVPIKDVASALKLTLAQTGRGIELTSAGGANQVSGVSGKIGDTLFNGFARFQVVKVVRGKEYTNQFSGDSQKVTPTVEADDLVVVVIHAKNAINDSITFMLPGGSDTALTDTDGHSYQFRSGMSMDIPSRGVSALPGAAVDFALTFDVPSSAKLGDLVYQLSLAGFGTNGSEKKKFRVSLQQ